MQGVMRALERWVAAAIAATFGVPVYRGRVLPRMAGGAPQDLLAASGGQVNERVYSFTATVDPASINAGASGNTTVTVPGGAELLSTDLIVAIPPSTLTAGLAVVGAYYATATTLTLRLTNASAGAIDAASGTWTFLVFRK